MTAIATVCCRADHGTNEGTGMNDYVFIGFHRNRGWPWPEASWGLTPMFGEEGWCRSCGVPLREQSSPLVIQGKSLPRSGGWIPYWRFDAFCLSRPLAQRVHEQFGVGLLPVFTPSGRDADADQLIVPTSSLNWFEPSVLREAIAPIHPEVAETCTTCGTTRWMPVGMERLPAPDCRIFEDAPAAIASPEWFGAGMRSFSQILWRADLAEHLLSVAPKDFRVRHRLVRGELDL